MGRPKVSEDVVRALLAKKNWDPVEGWEYVDGHTPIPGRCLVEGCGYESPPDKGPRYGSLKQRGRACGKCANRERTAPEEDVRALLADNNWKPVEPLKYVNAHTPIPGQCLICGYEGTGPRLHDIKSRGSGACSICFPQGRPKIPEEVVRDLLAKNDWEPTEPLEYSDLHTPIPGQCLICGYEGQGPQYGHLKQGGGACPACAEYGYNPAKPGYLYTFVFTDDSGVDFICYGITNYLGKRRYQYERHFAIRGFQALRFEDGAKASRVEKLFHDIRKASNAPYPNSQVDGTKTEAFPLSDFELCTVFNHHWIAADAVSNNKYSLHAPNGELVKQRP
jgi:hypothetical protein